MILLGAAAAVARLTAFATGLGSQFVVLREALLAAGLLVAVIVLILSHEIVPLGFS